MCYFRKISKCLEIKMKIERCLANTTMGRQCSRYKALGPFCFFHTDHIKCLRAKKQVIEDEINRIENLCN